MFAGQALRRAVHQWGEYPSLEILLAPSAEAYADAAIDAMSEGGELDIEQLMSEVDSSLDELRRDLLADYDAKWERIQAGGYETLYDCRYPCPKCKHKDLQFKNVGHWD